MTYVPSPPIWSVGLIIQWRLARGYAGEAGAEVGAVVGFIPLMINSHKY